MNASEAYIIPCHHQKTDGWNSVTGNRKPDISVQVVFLPLAQPARMAAVSAQSGICFCVAGCVCVAAHALLDRFSFARSNVNIE